jgi:hypothetical protein
MALFMFLLGAATMAAVGLAVLRRLGRPSAERDRAARAIRRAACQVDDVFREARIRMEEAVGRRRPGEGRLDDSLRGSWRDW